MSEKETKKDVNSSENKERTLNKEDTQNKKGAQNKGNAQSGKGASNKGNAQNAEGTKEKVVTKYDLKVQRREGSGKEGQACRKYYGSGYCSGALLSGRFLSHPQLSGGE